MDYQLIANILLAILGFVALAVMLRWDLMNLQQKSFSSKEFMDWLQSTDESYSTKRIVPMAALVACATPWARQSWMVVALIAVAMVALVVTMFHAKHEKPLRFTRRLLFIGIITLVVAAACAVSLITARFSLEAGMLMLLFTAFSYVLVLGVNWLAQLVKPIKPTKIKNDNN